MVSKKQSGFIKDVVVTFLGQIIVLVTNFLINKMIAIFVGVSAFGIFNITKRSATVIGFIILLELGISIPRYFAMNLNITVWLLFLKLKILRCLIISFNQLIKKHCHFTPLIIIFMCL